MTSLESMYAQAIATQNRAVTQHLSRKEVDDTTASEFMQFSETTGFTQYWDAQDAVKMLEEHPQFVVRGKLEMMKAYGLGIVYSKVHNSNIYVSTKAALNRSLHGDDVLLYVFRDENAMQKVIRDWELNDSATENVLVIKTKHYKGVVVYNYTAAAGPRDIVLECTVGTNAEKRSTQLVNPLDQRYPSLNVIFKAKIPGPDEILKVTVSTWYYNNMYPDGILVSEGTAADDTATNNMDLDSTVFNALQPLDKLTQYALSTHGVPYTFPEEHDASEYEQLVDQELDVLAQLFDIPRSNVEATCDLSHACFDSLMRQISTDKFQADLAAMGRRSFCDDLVFTIDPDTARDFDDAIHIVPLVQTGSGPPTRVSVLEYMEKYMDEGKIAHTLVGFEVGIHIADASYYLDKCPWLDEMARKTMFSVYMSDKVCPMLPPKLSTILCSLNPIVPRMAFSIVVQINTDGKLLPQEVWFGRSIIFSYARLDYTAAQRFIDNSYSATDVTTETTKIFDTWPCIEGFAPAIAQSVVFANQLAAALRKLRRQYGALIISMPEERYNINKETLVVSHKDETRDGEAHHLIEEFMLIANCLVAQKLVLCFPTLPILRIHQACKVSPTINKFFVSKNMRVIDLKSVAQITDFIDQLSKNLESLVGEDHSRDIARQIFVSECLSKATYKIGMTSPPRLLIHWGIHTQLYMHFTSPIRRYPDDIAHRLLHLGLSLECKKYGENPNYATSQEATFRPYKLEIKKPTDLYGNALFNGTKALQKMAMNHYQKSTEIEQTVASEHHTSGEIEMRVLFEGVPIGTDLKSFSMASVLKEIKSKYNSNALTIHQQDDRMQKLEEEVESIGVIAGGSAAKSVAERIFKEIEDDVATIGYSFTTLNAFVEHANMMELKISSIETINHRAMIALLISQTPEFKNKGGIDVTAYIPYPPRKDKIMFYVPEYRCTFTLMAPTKGDSASTITLEAFSPHLSVEKQRHTHVTNKKGLKDRIVNYSFDAGAPAQDEDAATIEIPILSPLKARIVPVCKNCQNFWTGVDLLLTEYADKVAEKQVD